MEIVTKHKKACKECTNIYEVSRDWQLFCGIKCRTKFNKHHREICFYCGERGNHRHHIDPRAASGKNYFKGVEYVFSCGECNIAIGDGYFQFLHEEVDYLIRYYTHKYSLRQAVVEWSEEELGELGWNLKARINKMLATRGRVEDRVYYLKSVRNYLLTDIDFD